MLSFCKKDIKLVAYCLIINLIRILQKITQSMKKFLLVVSAAALTFAVACKKDKKDQGGGGNTTPTYAVEPYQNATVFYFGGTWCGPCGAYGKPAKETLHKNNPKLTILSAQLNGSGGSVDPFNSPTSNSFASFFGVTSLPTMFLGGASQLMPSWVGNYIVAATVQAKIDEFRAFSPTVNAKMSFSKINDAVTAAITFQFYKATTNEFYFNVIATESELVKTQASDASTKKGIHDNVLRIQSGGTALGELLTSGATEKQVLTKNITLTLDPSWKKENIQYHVIIWEKNPTNNKYSLCNSASANIQ